jgi:hypothetical protein
VGTFTDIIYDVNILILFFIKYTKILLITFIDVKKESISPTNYRNNVDKEYLNKFKVNSIIETTSLNSMPVRNKNFTLHNVNSINNNKNNNNNKMNNNNNNNKNKNISMSKMKKLKEINQNLKERKRKRKLEQYKSDSETESELEDNNNKIRNPTREKRVTRKKKNVYAKTSINNNLDSNSDSYCGSDINDSSSSSEDKSNSSSSSEEEVDSKMKRKKKKVVCFLSYFLSQLLLQVTIKFFQK